MLKWLGRLAASTDKRLELLRSKDAEQRADRWLLRGQIGAVIILGFVVLVAVFQLAGTSETISATARNFGLIVIAPIGIWLAYRRTTDATRQVETQIRQADTAERGHDNDRFQTAVSMLGSGDATSEIAAIESLEKLMTENREAYEAPIRRILASTISNRQVWEPETAVKKQVSSFANSRIWYIFRSSFFERDGRYPVAKVIIENCDCEFRDINTKHFANVEFRNVVFRRIFVGNTKNGAVYRDCEFAKIRFAKDIRSTNRKPLFIQCKFGNFSSYQMKIMGSKKFGQFFSRCKTIDGKPMVYEYFYRDRK